MHNITWDTCKSGLSWCKYSNHQQCSCLSRGTFLPHFIKNIREGILRVPLVEQMGSQIESQIIMLSYGNSLSQVSCIDMTSILGEKYFWFLSINFFVLSEDKNHLTTP